MRVRYTIDLIIDVYKFRYRHECILCYTYAFECALIIMADFLCQTFGQICFLNDCEAFIPVDQLKINHWHLYAYIGMYIFLYRVHARCENTLYKNAYLFSNFLDLDYLDRSL